MIYELTMLDIGQSNIPWIGAESTNGGSGKPRAPTRSIGRNPMRH